MAKPRTKKKRAADKPTHARKTNGARSGSTRNPELEARLVAQPDDSATRGVYADWLQSVGDPLGELLALENAGEEKLAQRLLAKCERELVGVVDEGTLDWRRGLIDKVHLGGSAAHARKQLAAILDRPAALVVRELTIGLPPDRALLDLIATVQTLRHIVLFGGRIGGLASPTLWSLEVFLDRDIPLDFDSLGPLLGAVRVPALRRIDFLRNSRDKPLPLPFLEVLLDSKLLRQLEWLAFRQEVINTRGVELLLRRRDALAHLRGVFIDTCEPAIEKQIIDTFGVQHTDRPGTGKYANTIHAVGSWETWPGPTS